MRAASLKNLAFYACALSTSLVFASPAASSTAPIVNLGYTQYEGTFNETTGVTRFVGMRYAAPPTGPLRWKKPHPPTHKPGVQKADTFGNPCLFGITGSSPTSPFRNTTRGHLVQRQTVYTPSEDCLFLNVWTPTTLDTKKPLPVIFWIHGGGYVAGDTTAYNADDLVQTSKNGVVIVTIQYRLGLFGFLAGKEIKKGGALNAGLLDQQFALKWVQQNIRKFGGDPSHVTIWGESAGAGSVLQHVVANGGKTSPPLFKSAITSSTFLPSQYQYDDPISEAIYSEAVSQSGCSTAPNTLSCLRQADVSVLQQAHVNISTSGFFGTFVFVPVIDGTFIRQRPSEALKHGKTNGKALLSVTNTFEGALFINPNTTSDVDVQNYITQLFPKFSTKEVSATAKQYQGLGNGLFQVTAIMGESIFICPTYWLLDSFGGHGYKGKFAVPPGGHGQDVPFYFPSIVPLLPATYNNTDFIKAFAGSFTNFAISQNPNVKRDPTTITPSWSQWRGGAEMLFNRTEAGLPDIRAVRTDSALLERCRLWKSVSTLTGQ